MPPPFFKEGVAYCFAYVRMSAYSWRNRNPIYSLQTGFTHSHQYEDSAGQWVMIKVTGVLQTIFYARLQTGHIMVWWCPSVHSGLRPSVTVFRTFLLHALTYWADILHVTFFLWTFDQLRVSSISVKFCKSYVFFILKYWKYTVFRTFLLHALTYCTEISHMTLFYCTTGQVWVLSIGVNFWNVEYWKYTVFRTFLLHALTYWAEILHISLFYCTTDQVQVLSICVNFCSTKKVVRTYIMYLYQDKLISLNMNWNGNIY